MRIEQILDWIGAFIKESINEIDDLIENVSGRSSEMKLGEYKFTDLGLPSGTRWALFDVPVNPLTAEEVLEKYYDKLPTKTQFEELCSECQFKYIYKKDWRNNWRIIGENGKELEWKMKEFMISRRYKGYVWHWCKDKSGDLLIFYFKSPTNWGFEKPEPNTLASVRKVKQKM